MYGTRLDVCEQKKKKENASDPNSCPVEGQDNVLRATGSLIGSDHGFCLLLLHGFLQLVAIADVEATFTGSELQGESIVHDGWHVCRLIPSLRHRGLDRLLWK